MSEKDIAAILEAQWQKYELRYMLDAANEIRRLRGLLREMRDGGAMADSPDMWRRIDEALGDDR